MIIGSLFEFFLGNTFPFVVFGSFGRFKTAHYIYFEANYLLGAFWFSYGGTLQPFYNAAGAYADGDQATGLTSPGFTNSFGTYFKAPIGHAGS
jgi:succinate-acetate transporter protein